MVVVGGARPMESLIFRRRRMTPIASRVMVRSRAVRIVMKMVMRRIILIFVVFFVVAVVGCSLLFVIG